jgi:hypothetical protein
MKQGFDGRKEERRTILLGGTEGGWSWYLQRGARLQRPAHDSTDEMVSWLALGPAIIVPRPEVRS